MSAQAALKPRPARSDAGRRHSGTDAECELVRTNTESSKREDVTLEQSQIVHLHPDELTIHPDVTEVAPLNDQEVEQLRQAITEAGRILQPLIINSARQVLDGRHRRALASEIGLESVPCLVDNSSDAIDVAISSALDRRHLTQGQRALFVYKLHRIPRQQRGKAAPDNKVRASGGAVLLSESLEGYQLPSFRELARRYGVSDPVFGWLHQLWNNTSDEEWQEIVRLVESGEQRLKSIYHGFGGRLKTKGQMRPPERIDKQQTRFLTAIKMFSKKWDRLDLQDRTEFVLKLVDTVASASPDMAAVLEKAFEQARLSQKQK